MNPCVGDWIIPRDPEDMNRSRQVIGYNPSTEIVVYRFWDPDARFNDMNSGTNSLPLEVLTQYGWTCVPACIAYPRGI